MERKHPLAECESCPLYRKDAAFTTGPADASVAVVSRSPGRYDAERRRPFAGPSGLVLDHLLDMYGRTRENTLVTNLVLCESDDPPRKAIECCSKRLQSEIAKADTVIAAGAEPALVLARRSITRGRGIVHERWASQDGGLPKQQRVIVTNNPVMVIRDSDTFPNLVEDFKLALDPPPPVTLPEVKVHNTAASVRSLLTRLSSHDLIATDLEGHYPHTECIGLSIDGLRADVISRAGFEKAEKDIKNFFESKLNFLWHNGIYDVKLLKRNGIAATIGEDTFALSYLLDERPGTHGLAYLLRLYLGWPNYEPEAVIKYKDTGVLPESIDDLYEYNGLDTAGTFQLFNQIKTRVEEEGTLDLYHNVYIPFFNSLTDVERRGFIYDIHRAADLNEDVVLPRLAALSKQLADLAKLEFYNPRSNPQTKAIVYDRWQLKHHLRGARGKTKDTSFDKDVRREIINGRFESPSRYRERLVEFATIYDAFSSIDKQRGTFIEGLIKRTTGDGRLYCEFNPCGTVTGRTSSRNPNFQNITRSGRDVVPGIRTLFLPSPGNVIIQADYSQAELRCIAKFSQDRELLSIYRDSKRSLHKETCEKFYGKKYTKDEYTKAKNINFGVCYGQGAKAFSQMYVMPVEEAQAYIDNWFKMFPQVWDWREEVKAIIDRDQLVVAPTGFRRRFHLITADNEEECYREGINFLPQHTAGMLTIKAVAELNNLHSIPVVSTVHDSIIADVPADEAQDVAKVMKQVMEEMPIEMLGWSVDEIPFKVDISVGPTWGEVEEIQLD